MKDIDLEKGVFASGEKYFKTIALFEDLGFLCKENTTHTSSICVNPDKKLEIRINQLIDSDGDGVPDGVDCEPFNPFLQDMYGTGALHPIGRDEKQTFNGFSLQDYYFSDGDWHVRPGAKPVFKKSIFGFIKR